MSSDDRTVERIPAGRIDDVVDVLADAFRGYPVMRFTVGPAGDNEVAGDLGNAARERRLVRLFVERRIARGGPLYGLFGQQKSAGYILAGAIVLSRPDEPAATPEVAAISAAAWRELGDDARLRYEQYAAASNFFADLPPHLHLNMIGVRGTHKGTGLGRVLLERVIDLAEGEPRCAGVSLTTENPRNVDLYQHFGYDVIGEGTFGPGIPTWGLYLRIR